MEKTLNLPKTDFSQRSNAPTREPELLKLWKNTFTERNKLNTKKTFKLHDGPCYTLFVVIMIILLGLFR